MPARVQVQVSICSSARHRHPSVFWHVTRTLTMKPGPGTARHGYRPCGRRAAVEPWEPLQAVLPATRRSMLRPFAVRLVSVFTHLFLSATSVVACYDMPVKETVSTLLCLACQLLLAPDGRPTRTTSPFRSRAFPARSIPGRMSSAESGWGTLPAAPRSAFARTWKP